MGVAAEKVVKFTTFSGSASTARHVGGMFGVGEMTIRMRAMRRRGALVYQIV
jgi:hypothetical protein